MIISFHKITAQDSLHIKNFQNSTNISKLNIEDKTHHFSYKKLIVPTIFISYGIAGLSIKGLQNLNSSTQYEIGEHKPEHKIR